MTLPDGWTIALDDGGRLRTLPDDADDADANAARIGCAVRAALASLRERYDAGDVSATLEAFLLIVGVLEWQRRTGASALPHVETWWGGPVPIALREVRSDDVEAARELWRTLRRVDEAAEGLRRPVDAESVSGALRDLLAGVWAARRVVRGMAR